MPEGDKKFIFMTDFTELASSKPGTYNKLGRIIFRGNQTLLAEGVPFTPENNCQYQKFNYDTNLVYQSMFCCTKFS